VVFPTVFYQIRSGERGSIPDRGRGFFSSPCVQTGSGAHPASYPVGTGGPFPGGKARPGRDADHSLWHVAGHLYLLPFTKCLPGPLKYAMIYSFHIVPNTSFSEILPLAAVPCNTLTANSMEQSDSSEANSRSASQEISLLLYNLKVHYRVHKNRPVVPILSQTNPVHILTLDSFDIPFEYYHPIYARSPKWSLPVRFSN
jgi:hypothetical protein